MVGPNFLDDIDCGNFFDQIDDLLDFPPEDLVEGGAINDGDEDGVNNVCPTPAEDLKGPTSVFSGNHSSSAISDLSAKPTSVFSGNHSNCAASDLSAELSVPYEDIVQLEWLSNFFDDDSFSAGSMTVNTEDSFANKDSSRHQFQTSSPVSVLESSSSCSGGKPMSLSPETVVPGRARSKRPRPATFNPRPAMQLISPTSSITETQQFATPRIPSETESFAESRPMKKSPKQASEHKKKKKMKLSPPLSSEWNEQNPPSQSVRKCLHCEITKTPQWRAGPLGPKTLCNACGVRYKSGRLFPEYRPAASPTFVPSLHSNSHKKVLEMRNKTGDKINTAGVTAAAAASEEFIPASHIHMEYL
ncbi:Zinc finger, GATA-type [Dillenia turbinata]|uniref:Zinc finger, GATA-type n=1 Tax=Dillenia turbinata TaxID=194707 RepID=A0AAN8VNW5_9MAGN